METKKLEVRVTERSTAEGRKFNVYHTFSKNGRKTELKFKKDVKPLPDKDCYIEVPVSAMNLNTSGRFPVLWVSEVLAIHDNAEVRAEANAKKINEYFGC